MRLAYVGSFAPSSEGWRHDEDRVARALERTGSKVVRIEGLVRDLDARLEYARPDWVLFSGIRELTPRLLERVRRRIPRLGCAQVLFDLMDYEERLIPGIPWMMRSRLSWWLPTARCMDIVFIRERGHLARYARDGVNGYYLDQAADSEESPAPAVPEASRCDVAFFGSFRPERAKMLKRLGAGRSLRVYSSRPERWRRAGLPSEPAANDHRLGAAVAAARIVYGDNARNDIDGYWSDRVFRVLGNRGFFLTRYVPGLEGVFENHVHLVWGCDDDEIASLASTYLADASARQRIAQQGFEHVRAHHTYDHRVREMLQVLESVRPAVTQAGGRS